MRRRQRLPSGAPPRFALIGAAGYVAPRHMDAIAANGYELVAALDPHDSVGVIDRYAPEAAFFTEFERFDRHLDKLRREGRGVDYVAVCSPNYLHDAHARLGLRLGADVICEKPLVLNARNARGLREAEGAYGRRVWCVLQARLHPEAERLRAFVAAREGRAHVVRIDYVTPRGRWYDYSWKSAADKSGGVATNIGIHLFDLVLANFGMPSAVEVRARTPRTCAGVLACPRGTVEFRLSVDARHLPDGHRGRRRVFEVDGEAFDLSGGFDELHRETYRRVVAGEGFGIADALPAIELAERIRATPAAA